MNMKDKWIAGVDLGGTMIKMAFLSADGDILYKWEIGTNLSEKGKYIVKDICKSLEEKLTEFGRSKKSLLGVGIGVPGPVDLKTGVVNGAVNLHWDVYPVKEEIERLLSVPTVVDNDANVAALGEMWKGAGNGANDLVCVTLGTGIGGGVIINGEIVHGVNGAGGEIGHITAIPVRGARCNCGKTGCIETIASATGIARIATEKISNHHAHSQLQQNGKVTAKQVFNAAKNGDSLALEVVEEITFHLGIALANIANTLNPEKIVLGGGVSKAGDILVKKVTDYFQKYAFPSVRESTSITLATLGNDAGVIGAGWLVKSKLNS